jgi:hypothetical protein
VRLGALLMALCVLSSAASAQTLIFSSPGSYVLAADAASSAEINVWIATDHVTLDLNGNTIRCVPSDPSSASTTGIYARSMSHITIRNGRITGCMFGVSAAYASAMTIENVDFTGNTYIGAYLGWGSGHIVRRNKFNAITGYTPEAYAIGLNGIGSNGLVEDNEFRDLHRQPHSIGVGEGVGVLIEENATDVIVRRNVFANANLTDHAIRLWLAQGGSATVTNNTFANWQYAIASMGSITVSSNTFRVTGAVTPISAIDANVGTMSGNTFSGYAGAPVSGNIGDGGGNIITPPEPTPVPNGRFFRVCVDNATTCYEGRLPRAPGGA